jgi:hypothetical protein
LNELSYTNAMLIADWIGIQGLTRCRYGWCPRRSGQSASPATTHPKSSLGPIRKNPQELSIALHDMSLYYRYAGYTVNGILTCVHTEEGPSGSTVKTDPAWPGLDRPVFARNVRLPGHARFHCWY